MKLKITQSLRRDMETDFPPDLKQLLDKLKEFKKQISEEKADFKLQLAKDPIYRKLTDDIDELEHDINKEIQELKEVAFNHAVDGRLDVTVNVGGAPFRFQTENELMMYINGKTVK